EAAAIARAAGREAAIHPEALAEDAPPDIAGLGVEGVVLAGAPGAAGVPQPESACRRALREAAPSVLLV
ncbi:MAG: hypothetical protein NZM27_02910, partial [Acetobacteraceae bacterium]|nr:hypothetical protein [Acetobacteraceae bacterium]